MQVLSYLNDACCYFLSDKFHFHYLTVEVYKCEYLADTCGECTLLDPAYRCGWCEDRCTLPEFCVSPRDSKLLTRDQICPDPKITKVSSVDSLVVSGTLWHIPCS